MQRAKRGPFRKIWHAKSDDSRIRIGRQSEERTLRGLLLSRRSLPFKPPPVLSATRLPALFLSVSHRLSADFLSPSCSLVCTLGNNPAEGGEFLSYGRRSPRGETKETRLEGANPGTVAGLS